ncbi:MAG: F0F1 ATP synthase subunit epsilon [Gammaproteobacteria bacterium]|nr:F0F1 ATP synthase subunit epsilon [Gammaproteobacteria bacterium]
MKTFKIFLQSSTKSEIIDKVISFVSEDASGSFGILAHHARFMTCLQYSLAWFRYDNDEVEYLALPGGVLYFVANNLTINTRQYLRSKNYQEIDKALGQLFQDEEDKITDLKKILHNLDTGILKQLREMQQG